MKTDELTTVEHALESGATIRGARSALGLEPNVTDAALASLLCEMILEESKDVHVLEAS